MSEIHLKHKIALGLIPHIGDINARKLVSHFGSVEAIFHEPYRDLIKIPGIGSGIAKYITDRTYLDTAEKETEYVTKNNIKTYFYLDMIILSDSDNVMILRLCFFSRVTAISMILRY